MSKIAISDILSPQEERHNSKIFSPMTVRESPVSKTPQRGNLTGNPRRIRDLAADLYNLIQTWNGHHVTGSDILNKINSLKSTEMKEDGNIDFMKGYPKGLQNLCDELDQICTSLEEIVLKMASTTAEVGGVVKLEKLKNNSDNPMFLTWPAYRFEDVWKLVLEAYQSEFNLKKYIKENVAHVTTEPNLMFFIASWVHQPYIHSNIDVSLEALLKETGHK